VYRSASQAIAQGHLPIFLGGDHSMAIGTIGGITHQQPAGVIWIDAHGDFNVPASSPNGNIHGMPVAVLTGQGAPELVNLGRPGPKLEPKDIVLVATRNLDFDERKMLRSSGIRTFTMRDIDERGMATIAREALQHLNHRDRLHISLDMDALDPVVAPGVGTPASGGLTCRETHLLMEIISDTKKTGSMDIVEINPTLDQCNQTGKTAVELTTSLLGQRII